jgi:hypothetical protein
MRTPEEKANMILKALLGSDEAVQQWWARPNKAFEMATPDELWQTPSGRNHVYSYLLDQMEAPH